MGLTELVCPHHPIVAGLWELVGDSGTLCSTQDLVQAAVAASKIWRYQEEPGFRTYEQVEAHGCGNCLSLSCILCAALRYKGLRHVYVVLGGYKGFFPMEVHAWVLYWDDQAVSWFIIDPAHRIPERCTLGSLAQKFVILSLFNDQVAYMTAEERQAFLTEEIPK